MKRHAIFGFALTVAATLCTSPGYAKDGADDKRADDSKSPPAAAGQCKGLPSHSNLVKALKSAVAEANGGFGLQMWATIVDRDGFVCAVAFSGADRDDQWPGSRVISAQKAHTANAFSLDGLALSTANLYTAVQPGGTLFGLQESNPVDPKAAYKGNPKNYGTPQDGMVGEKVGGINVFGGGLGLYTSDSQIIGGLGVSGDSSCADHNIAWRVRRALRLDRNGTGPKGVSSAGTDAIVYDIIQSQGTFRSPSGWGHPECSPAATDIAVDIGAGVEGLPQAAALSSPAQ
ncbi:heme-binding protein (plasmid) [Skermanella sp. TT6]|uniref:Heme-binding protein n=1 Tax=Skermanella cutis TaxID=2775420 RepID=A0ABX7BFH6_9PROT|nr:heme-binding protein [Skermanella sp. TT6]QQP93149.1 heme-binding protein [Skermanella sp. TT6]